MERQFEYQVSIEELDYLKQLASKDKLVAGLLRFQNNEHRYNVTICFGRAGAEQLREYLTVRLAAVGFGKDYSPNEDGRMLEKLIDIFYVR